jgi:hypothetical protein
VLTVWPLANEEFAGNDEDVADALQVLGWCPLPVSYGAERLYTGRAGHRLRI